MPSVELMKFMEEFVVEGEKLHKYGIMTSTESSKIREKMVALGLHNNVDYLLADVREQLKSGTKYKKKYYLTPAAFKKCLMRAQRRANQPVDPVIYIALNVKLKHFFRNISIASKAVVPTFKALLTMSASITLEHIDAMLLQQSIQTGKELAYEDAEQMIQSLIDLLGMDPEKKAIIDGLVHLKGDYPIDAETMLKSLGALANAAYSGEVKRMLERARIIPKGQKIAVMPADMAAPFVSYVNSKCQIIRDIKHENGQTYPTIKYRLTINAAHKVLMRAYNDDTFADYFSIQLQLIGKYQKYQSDYRLHLKEIESRQDKSTINDLTGEVKDLKHKIDNMHHEHSAKMNEMLRRQEVLLDHAEEQSKDLKEVKEQLAGIFDFMIGLARFALPMWNGASVFKSQLDQLLREKSIDFALKHLKVLFTVAFYKMEDGHADMTIYFCCTNFEDVRDRINTLYKRHVEDTDDPMIMLKPAAICLISQEINCERSNLSQLVFDTPATYSLRRKSFSLSCEAKKHRDVYSKYNSIVENARKEDLQGYQIRRSKIVEDESYSINQNIINHLTESDNRFFAETLPFCSQFIDYQTVYVRGKLLKFGYKLREKISKKKIYRDDLDMKLSRKMYPLFKINEILIRDTGVNQIDAMVNDGIISKSNVKSLFRTAKAAAEAEDLKFDKKTQEQVDAINEDDLPDTDDEDF